MDQSLPLAATAQRVVCPDCVTEQDLLGVDHTCSNGGSTGEAQAMDTPSSSLHAERGGSGG